MPPTSTGRPGSGPGSASAAARGSGPGEQLALAPRDLTPQGLRVERTYHGVGQMGPPKGGRSRVVEVSAVTSGLLMQRALGGHPFLFPGRHQDRPLDHTALGRAFGRAVHRAGLPGHFTPHCLRHTYASLLLAAGAPPQYVRQQMGHAVHPADRGCVRLLVAGLPARPADTARRGRGTGTTSAAAGAPSRPREGTRVHAPPPSPGLGGKTDGGGAERGGALRRR